MIIIWSSYCIGTVQCELYLGNAHCAMCTVNCALFTVHRSLQCFLAMQRSLQCTQWLSALYLFSFTQSCQCPRCWCCSGLYPISSCSSGESFSQLICFDVAASWSTGWRSVWSRKAFRWSSLLLLILSSFFLSSFRSFPLSLGLFSQQAWQGPIIVLLPKLSKMRHCSVQSGVS